MSSRDIEHRTVYHNDIFRFFASSRILTVITWPIILLVLFMKLDEKNIDMFLAISTFLIFLLWINIILVSIRTFDPAFSGGIKFTKILLLTITSILSYALFYTGYLIYSPDNSFFVPTDYMKNSNVWQKFFDMTFVSTNITTTLGYNSDITPKGRFLKWVVMSQCLSTIILLIILVSRFS
jgi:hypothetical protein